MATRETAPHSAPEIDPARLLRAMFQRAIRDAFPTAEGDVDPLITQSKQPEHGDYQSNVAMNLGKKAGLPPREAAARIVQHIPAHDLIEPLTAASIAGPGFINIRLAPKALGGLLQGMSSSSGLGLGVPTPSRSATIVVDLMGVNLAKNMHVGHLRSPVIGDAIARCLERLGHKVIRQNHVGDWGLNIAMTTARVMRLVSQGALRLDTLTLDELDKAYVAAQAECQRDLSGLEAAKRWNMGPKAIAELQAQVDGATEAFLAARTALLDLQSHEPRTYTVWQRIYSITMQACIDTCRELNIAVTDEHTAGESTYARELGPMVDELVAKGIALQDQGALIVRLDDDPVDPLKEPCLVRKTDGGYLYATTDVCAIRRRVQHLGAERLIYVIDARQNLHLRQVFGVSRKAGYAVCPPSSPAAGTFAIMEHALFGSVLGEDGKPFKTRSGETVKLSELVRETFERAHAAIASRNPDLTGDEAHAAARSVGIAALKYADLSNDRAKDYTFSFDRMLAFEGNTGPYLLYALVRIKSIFRKAQDRGLGDGWREQPFEVREPAEKLLALALLRYPGALASSGLSLEPHRLCTYLYELAGAFSTFFDKCPVLTSETGVRESRLKLCDLAGRVLQDGLSVLGIPPAERM